MSQGAPILQEAWKERTKMTDARAKNEKSKGGPEAVPPSPAVQAGFWLDYAPVP